MLTPYAARPHEKMREVLKNPQGSGPEIHYYMIRGGSEKTNITVWESGTIDGEYIKTYGHYHVGGLDETYTVLQGEGIIIMQNRVIKDGVPVDDEIESFRAIRAREGDKVFIPSGAGHLAVNISDTWFVTSDDSPVNFEEKDAVSLPGHADYTPFEKLQGAAYYVVEENGEPKLVKNPKYKVVPDAEIELA